MLSLLLWATQDPVGMPNDALLRNHKETHLINIRQLTFGGQNAEAYWNEEGTKLIYQSTQPHWPDEQIMVMNADGTGKKLVSRGLGRCTCGYFVPSKITGVGGPSNGEIIYSSTDWWDQGPAPKPDMSRGYVWRVNPYFRIFRSDLDGSNRRMLIERRGYQAETTIAPNGSFMAFTSTMHGDLEIFRADLEGKNIRRLTNVLGYDGGPFVSWDSKKIVFRRSSPMDAAERAAYLTLLKQSLLRPSRLDIWVMNADGTNQRQITRLGGASFAPSLHPDGKRIIFSSNHADSKGREFDLYVIRLDGTSLKRITYAPEFDGFPMFTRDGKRLVWASNRNGKIRGETNIFVADWKEQDKK